MGEIREIFEEIRRAYQNQEKRLKFLDQMALYIKETTDYRLFGESTGWAGHSLDIVENEGTVKQGSIWKKEFTSDEEAILWALRNPVPPKESASDDEEKPASPFGETAILAKSHAMWRDGGYGVPPSREAAIAELKKDNEGYGCDG